jgi:pimeloyl-ACP methyl ester carboxylesterase
MKIKSSLFLHWGPGASAGVERAWFQDRLPVLWWDQPTSFRDASNSLSELVLEAEEQLRTLSEAAQRPIGLIAHSSGGQIAYELTRRIPERIQSVTLLSCNASPARAFIHLGRHLAKKTPVLLPLVEKAREQLTPGTFWPLVQAIAAIPDFMGCYWKNDAARDRYRAIEKDCPPLHMETFQRVMQNLIELPPLHSRISSITALVPVDCYFGLADPLQDLDEEETQWKHAWPWARIHRLETGHFPHFEAEPGAWFKSSSIS